MEAATKKPDVNGKTDLQQTTKSETIDFKAVNYTEFIPIMIKGMQEMQAKIDAQQRKIEELEIEMRHQTQALFHPPHHPLHL